jgi:hypothetical protein
MKSKMEGTEGMAAFRCDPAKLIFWVMWGWKRPSEYISRPDDLASLYAAYAALLNH